MIVRDLGIVDIPLLPAEAHAPLVIDADIVLPRPVAGTFFESIPRRYRKTLERPPHFKCPWVGPEYGTCFPLFCYNLTGSVPQASGLQPQR